jgi:DNA repair exonuclease SbcCD ATPase subunit
MFEHTAQQVHFALVRNGYDRRQVDSDLAQRNRQATEARVRIEEAESTLAEITKRARALEAKISALRADSREEMSDAAAPVAEMAERLLQTVSAAGDDLPAQVLSQARTEREAIERVTSDVTRVARFRAARIIGSAERDREQADQLAAESRRQVDQYIDGARSAADERAQAAWDKARASLRQPMLEVEEIREQGRAKRRELKRLQDLRDDWWGRVAGDSVPVVHDLVEDVG